MRQILNMLRLFIIFLALNMASLAHAVEKNVDAQLAPNIKFQIFQLLAMDCGANSALNDFQQAFDKLEVDISPLLINILQRGIPEELQRVARKKANENYEIRQAWLKTDGGNLFDEQTLDQISKQNRDAYLSNNMRKLNLGYLENTIRGLGLIGKPNAIDSINQAIAQDPTLAILGKQAIEQIQKSSLVDIQ